MWVPARLALGITNPRKPVLGIVLAGEIGSTGGAVTSFSGGEQVFGLDRFGRWRVRRVQVHAAGGVLAAKPFNLSHEEAAAISYGDLLALHFLRKGGIRSGQTVLVYGASGAGESSAVQLVRHFGGASHWGVRHLQSGLGQFPRSGYGDRLHRGRLQNQGRELPGSAESNQFSADAHRTRAAAACFRATTDVLTDTFDGDERLVRRHAR